MIHVRSTLLLAFVAATTGLLAHPVPEIPVRSDFAEGGKASIKVEIEPRVWLETADQVPQMTHAQLKAMSPADREGLMEKVKQYAKDHLEFYFLPLGQVTPVFEWKVGGEMEKQLVADDQFVAVTGTWQTNVPSGIAGYQIKSSEKCKVGIYIHNFLNGKAIERLNVLFPGESSYVLDLTGVGGQAAGKMKGSIDANTTGGGWATFTNMMSQGFVHVVPMGLDHILFVLGLFLMSRAVRPLLLQVTMFTIAHTITLGLATLGWVSVSGDIVEPIIAGSIAVVALENIFHPKYTHWRLLIVFAFGLIHGLGFAGALSDLQMPENSLLSGLLGFNVGVEFGQLAVITGALLLTFWIKDQPYRKWVVIPVSLGIAVMGVYWMVERIVG